MIVNIEAQKKFLRNKQRGNIFIFCFPLLYSYEELLLKELKVYWPKLSVLISKKNLHNGDCIRFISKSCELYFVCLENTCDLEKNTKKLSMLNTIIKSINYSNEKVARVEFLSFVTGASKITHDKIMNVFAKSNKKFELYM